MERAAYRRVWRGWRAHQARCCSRCTLPSTRLSLHCIIRKHCQPLYHRSFRRPYQPLCLPLPRPLLQNTPPPFRHRRHRQPNTQKQQQQHHHRHRPSLTSHCQQPNRRHLVSVPLPYVLLRLSSLLLPSAPSSSSLRAVLRRTLSAPCSCPPLSSCSHFWPPSSQPASPPTRRCLR